MYTIKNESGDLLKYVFKDKIVFNGGVNARSIVVYRCKKYSSAEKLLEKCINAGFKNVEIVEISEDAISSIPKPKAPTKEDLVNYLEKPVTEDDINEYYNDEDDKDFNPEYLFEKFNEKCIGCSRNCKQSYKATIIRCPQYSPIQN